MGTGGVARPLTDPQHVGRAVVPVPGEGVTARECLFVAQDQCFVAGVEVHLVQLRFVLGLDPARTHESQRTVDLLGQLLVAPAFVAGGDELLVPGVHPAQVGEATLRERPEEVEGGCRLAVGGEEALRVGGSCVGREADAVHHVSAERRQLHVVDRLGGL